ncbi:MULTISPECIES: phage portal protein [unclassified Oceanobacillus]|uniref:phage portal protein n=1 Tax=unclassified Oceanobacillus TaxID=2630292 RepID=UPI001BE9DEC9
MKHLYPNTATETESLIELIEKNSPKVMEIIKEYIDNHDTSKMDEGVRYYFNESDIVDRQIYKYENDTKVADPDATNNKLPTGWHKTLVDQKISYLAGKPITIKSKDNEDPALEAINDILDDDFNDTLPELVKHASNKGIEWLHVYVNEYGKLDYIIVPAQEFIPVYDNTKRKNLIAGIRYYELDDDTVKIELWDDQQVTFYEESEDGIVIDSSYEVNPQSHFYYNDQGYGWSTDEKSAIPFIGFRNNEEAVSDLTFYKRLIDVFEKIFSDAANNIEDIQKVIYILKGYDGTNLEEFVTQLKRYRAVKTNSRDGAGVDIKQGDVPITATDSVLDRLTEQIYQAGQGVNISTDKFGGNPSGVSLQFLYSFLDMKADVMERKFSKALKQLMWFVCEYLSITQRTEIDYKNYSFTFNKSMITNVTEQVNNVINSMGYLSDETALSNHPWVKDVQQEMERKRQDEERLGDKQESLGGDDDEGMGGKLSQSDDSGSSKEDKCPDCSGRGKVAGKREDYVICQRCGGDGIIS